MMSSNFIRFAY